MCVVAQMYRGNIVRQRRLLLCSGFRAAVDAVRNALLRQTIVPAFMRRAQARLTSTLVAVIVVAERAALAAAVSPTIDTAFGASATQLGPSALQ